MEGSSLYHEVMFRNSIEAMGHDYRNIFQYSVDPLSAPRELSIDSTLFFDEMAGASQQVAALNFGSCCTSEFSGFDPYHKSYAACHGSRSPEEADSRLRPQIDESEDGLICSRLSSPGILQPLADRDLETALGTASKVANDDGIVHSPQDSDEAVITGLVMEKILRDHFQDTSEPSSCPSKTPANCSSSTNPSSTLRGIRERQDRSLMDTRASNSRIQECGMSQHRSPSGQPDQLARMVSTEFTLVRPPFRRPLEVTRRVELKTNRKSDQQKASRAEGLYQGPYPSFCAPSCKENKPIKRSTMVTDGVERANSRTRRRRRARISRGDSSAETQRMTHIAVERNRRKQMNDHLSALKALMPSTFVQKTDQASIIGGAVEFVKELEVLLESMLSKQRRRPYAGIRDPDWNRLNIHPGPLLCAPHSAAACSAPPVLLTSEDHTSRMTSKRTIMTSELLAVLPQSTRVTNELRAACRSNAATVEVKVLGSDAIVNITTHRRAKQLVKVIVALESLDLNILHISVTTSNSTVLYTFNVKVGPECRMTVNHIAATLQQTFNSLYANHALSSSVG